MKTFNVKELVTWGLTLDEKYGGYKLPVSFRENESIVKKIQKIVDTKGTNQVFYGDSKTVYFEFFEITENQKDDLLGKGRQYIDLQFNVDEDPIESKNGNLYLKMRVLGLRKSNRKMESNAPKEDF